MEQPVSKRFGRTLKQAIESKGISLRELARRSGLDVSFLSKILSGKRNPPSSEEDLINLARILEIRPEKLIIDAGRIPSALQDFFSDEVFIESLLSGKPPENPAPLRKGRSGRGLEDELL